MRNSRELTPEENRRVDAALAKFRTEFACWADMYAHNWDLLAFVLYEGIKLPVIDELAPMILGEKCVALHDARWCMLEVGSHWHFAIDHSDLAEPVDLTNFNPKQLNHTLSQRWQRLLDLTKQAR